jgi:hypothetical protein
MRLRRRCVAIYRPRRQGETYRSVAESVGLSISGDQPDEEKITRLLKREGSAGSDGSEQDILADFVAGAAIPRTCADGTALKDLRRRLMVTRNIIKRLRRYVEKESGLETKIEQLDGKLQASAEEQRTSVRRAVLADPAFTQMAPRVKRTVAITAFADALRGN